MFVFTILSLTALFRCLVAKFCCLVASETHLTSKIINIKKQTTLKFVFEKEKFVTVS